EPQAGNSHAPNSVGHVHRPLLEPLPPPIERTADLSPGKAGSPGIRRIAGFSDDGGPDRGVGGGLDSSPSGPIPRQGGEPSADSGPGREVRGQKGASEVQPVRVPPGG